VNLAGRGIALALQVLLLPLFLHVLGIEAVGLIGFYTTMFAALGVVEYAIGTMIMREMAKLSYGETGRKLQRDLLRTTEILYALLTLTVGVVVTVAAPSIVRIWLSKSMLAEGTLIRCVELMGWTVTLQLFGSLYLNVLNGLEHQLRSNILAIALACARGLGAFIAVFIVSATIEAYFFSQLIAVSLILVASALIGWRVLSQGSHRATVRPGLLLATWHETRSLTGAAMLFVLLSQADKLIASSLAPLQEFGYYVIASMIASLMWTIYGSIGTALMPRFTRLLALGAEDQVRALFHSASQFMALILLPAAIVAIFHAEPLVFLWTADSTTAGNAAPLVVLLTLGTLLACLACASNSLQLAAGFTDLNLLNNLVWALGLPLAYFGTLKYGVAGATIMWLLSGILSLALSPTIFHRRMLRGEQMRWYLIDLGIPASVAAGMGSLSVLLMSAPSSRLLIGFQLGLVWVITSFGVLLVCPALRIAAVAATRRPLGWIRTRS
jgi:O-antigen/teichoic acid export membrane protein